MIVQDGLRRMYAEQEDVFYYLTIMNENYSHPGMPEGRARRGDRGDQARHVPAAPRAVRRRRRRGAAPRVQLLGSGTILREVEAAAELLAAELGVAADVWSATSFTELARDSIDTDRWNMLHPRAGARAHQLGHRSSWPGARRVRSSRRPTTCAPSPSRSARRCRGPPVRVLGTDGFGRSDYRKALRRHFEVDRHHVVVATLSELAAEGAVP